MMRRKNISLAEILATAVFVLAAVTLFVGPAQARGQIEVSDCVKCHEKEPASIAEKGGKHKSAVTCLDCHLEHGPWGTEIIPECAMCHEAGEKAHYGLGDRKVCMQCHSDPHKPLDLQLADNVTKPCLTCHEQQGQEFAQYESKHAQLSCTFCHERHGWIPDCSKCHEPHAEGQVMADCLVCHPVHHPLQIVPPVNTERASCVPCHEEIGALMARTTTKHQTFTCAFCHRGTHPNIPKCQGCHGEPHSALMHKKIPNCVECHIDPHNLQK